MSRFRLEAVMLGNPMAVISGTRYKVGSEVPAIGNAEIRFKLIEVSHRSVLLQYEEFVFSLRMRAVDD